MIGGRRKVGHSDWSPFVEICTRPGGKPPFSAVSQDKGGCVLPGHFVEGGNAVFQNGRVEFA